jgi:hypothetical protein
MPPLLNLLYRFGLVLILPTPNNFKALFAVVNGLLASFGFGEERTFTQADWDELRKLREADVKKPPMKRPKGR